MALKENLLTPPRIVQELNKYIIGQKEAKKILAIALRDRWRRQHAEAAIRDEISPSNILMKGPTGTGKTELGRRIAKICNVPFVKVEATQYTERGYVGDDVKNMVHALANNAINIVKKEKQQEVQEKIEKTVNQIILDILIPPINKRNTIRSQENEHLNTETRKAFYKKIANGEMDNRTIEISVKEMHGGLGFISSGMMDETMMMQITNMMSKLVPTKTSRRRVTIKEAKKILREDQLEKHIDTHILREKAVQKTEEGIIFIDEIDKIAGGSYAKSGGPDVSREGVQRNLLPIVEGTTVNTKIGPIKTDYILFIAAGAFHNSKPSDLMPELQGRFPARVELQELTEEDYFHILQTPKNALTKQQKALLATEGITLDFTKGAIKAMAKAAFILNTERENIGARRLRTIITQVLNEFLFDVPEQIQSGSDITIDKALVENRLDKLLKEKSSSDYII